ITRRIRFIVWLLWLDCSPSSPDAIAPRRVPVTRFLTKIFNKCYVNSRVLLSQMDTQVSQGGLLWLFLSSEAGFTGSSVA
ncbi:MAG: hypothetical protein NZ482_03310, partial [Gloeomargarita sp. SKYG98]|nr:hypothetical protein [Gloeomargarita sp. SKYG98]